MNEVAAVGSNPQTLYIAIAAVTAALLTGFFSFLNMVSAKENKVSELRCAWADGLRNEVAEFAAAIQELAYLEQTYDNLHKNPPSTDHYEILKDHITLKQDCFKIALECAYKIRMRLNPKHTNENPDSPEAKLTKALRECTDLFNNQQYEECTQYCNNIRDEAAPILKSTWDLVKKGEKRYRIVRLIAQTLVLSGAIIIGYLALHQSPLLEKEKNKSEAAENQTPQIIPAKPVVKTSPTPLPPQEKTSSKDGTQNP